MNLSKHIKVTNGLDYASGTATREGAELDMSGWDGVLIIVKHAAIAASAVGDVHAEQDVVTGMAGAADLAGTKIAVVTGNANQIYCLDIYRPRERFIRGVVTKDGSNAQAEVMIYIQYTGRKLPVSNAGFDQYELHVSPAEGTK